MATEKTFQGSVASASMGDAEDDTAMPDATTQSGQHLSHHTQHKRSIAEWDADEERRKKMPWTTGEWVYANIQFWFVKGLILAATAFIGYHAKFGKETGALGFIRKFQQWCIHAIEEPIAGAGEKAGAHLAEKIGGDRGKWIGAKTHEVMAVFGGAFASTMVLFHGGNVVAPVVQWFENHRKNIIAGANRRWGKPGEEEKGNDKFKYLPHQSFMDVVKGRITAWLTVFGSFFTAFLVVGKSKGTNQYRLDRFEEWCARGVTGMGKNSKFGHIQLTEQMHQVAEKMPELFKGSERRVFWYKTARILALDFYATTASIIVWNFASRLSARARRHGEPFFTALKHELFGRKHQDAPAPAQDAAPDAKKDDTTPETRKPAADEKRQSPGSVVSGAVALQRQADRSAAATV